MEKITIAIKNLISIIRDLFKFLFFEYKHDSSVRNLYIEHAKKIDKIFDLHYAHTTMPEEMRRLIFEVSKEAVLYLHKDIIDFVEELQTLLFNLDSTYFRLEGLGVGEERTKICQNQYDLKMQIHEMQKKYLKVYRKHILNDGVNITNYLNSLFNKINRIEEKIDVK